MLGRELVKLGPEQDIGFGHIPVQQGDTSCVSLVLEGSTDDLEAGRDACAACNHEDLAGIVAVVAHLALGPAEGEGRAHVQGADVLRHAARGVGLDQEIDGTEVVVGRDGRVGTHDHAAIDLRLDGYMLAGGQPERGVRRGQREAVHAGAGRDGPLGDEGEVAP